MEPKEGLNVLTGETGAGKSVILKSIEFALGKKADRDFVRKGEDQALVEALFSVPESTAKRFCSLSSLR